VGSRRCDRDACKSPTLPPSASDGPTDAHATDRRETRAPFTRTRVARRHALTVWARFAPIAIMNARGAMAAIALGSFAACIGTVARNNGVTTSSAGGAATTTVSSGAGLDGGVGGAPSCVGGSVYVGPVLGQPCPPACGDPQMCCAPAYLEACDDAGGLIEPCMYTEWCTPHAGVVCTAPSPPAAGKFACFTESCSVGEVCIHDTPGYDGCESHSCVAPPQACAGMPTCACLNASTQLDDAGVVDAGSWPVCGPGPTICAPGAVPWSWQGCHEDPAGNPTVDVQCACPP
jgi:hypothetical protein